MVAILNPLSDNSNTSMSLGSVSEDLFFYL